MYQTISRVRCPDDAFAGINLGHRWDGRKKQTSKRIKAHQKHKPFFKRIRSHTRQECENGRAHSRVQNETAGRLLAPAADIEVFLSGLLTPDQCSSHTLLIWDLGWAARLCLLKPRPPSQPPSGSASFAILCRCDRLTNLFSARVDFRPYS